MTTDLDFHQQYETLQAQWRQHAINRKRHYLPYVSPSSKVDYVLVAEIPNVDEKKAEAENVKWGDYPLTEFDAPKSIFTSLGDLTLHYAARRHLCKTGETYYITDLGKAAIPAGEAKKLQMKEFSFWYCEFLKELELVAKPTATIIPVGSATSKFLKRKPKTDFAGRMLAEPILHWSKQVTGAAKMASGFFPNEWRKFQEKTGVEDIIRTTRAAYTEAGLNKYFGPAQSRLKRSFKEIDKHYMFTYKKQMSLIRSRKRWSHSGPPHPNSVN